MTKSPLAELPSKIIDWSTLTKAQDIFRRTELSQEWVFRGTSEKGYDGLKTTLERVAEEFDVVSNKVPDLEVKLILEFMRPYHIYGTEPPPKQGDTLDWLALMRHHGAPSRFLDFTFSLPVATYFALQKKRKGSPKIWAVNKRWLTNEVETIVKDNRLRAEFEKYARYRDGNAFRNIFLIHKLRFVSAVSPFRMNQRLTIQQGVFLCPGDVRQSFLSNLKAMRNWKNNVVEIIIDPSARADLLGALFRVNLNDATLFPGIDGFASSLWTKVAILKKLQGMEEAKSRSEVNLDIRTLARW